MKEFFINKAGLSNENTFTKMEAGLMKAFFSKKNLDSWKKLSLLKWNLYRLMKELFIKYKLDS